MVNIFSVERSSQESRDFSHERFKSDDGKVFNTIDECTEYENKIKRKHEEERRKKEEEIARRNELKKKQQERYESIQKHKKELLNEINEYQKDYISTAFDPLQQLLYELFR